MCDFDGISATISSIPSAPLVTFKSSESIADFRFEAGCSNSTRAFTISMRNSGAASVDGPLINAANTSSTFEPFVRSTTWPVGSTSVNVPSTDRCEANCQSVFSLRSSLTESNDRPSASRTRRSRSVTGFIQPNDVGPSSTRTGSP